MFIFDWKMIDKVCEACGKQYKTRYKLQRFCCQSCAQSGKKRASSICEYCKKEFQPKKTGAKFCSRECYNKSREQEIKNCKFCWAEFLWCRDAQQYCSIECRKKDIWLEVLEKQCPNCWKIFTTKDKDKVYCCQDCREHQDKNCELCGADFISNSYNQRVCEKCKPVREKMWRAKLRVYVCKYCWKEFEWTYQSTTCKDCIKELSSKQARKMVEDYNKLSKEEKQEINRRRWETLKDTIKNINKEYWNERQKKKAASLKQYYKNMTEEEYEEYHNNLLKRAEERLEKTWYMWPVQMPSVQAAIKNKSKAEERRKEFLNKKWYEVWEQFPLWIYRYDLRVWNTLIEVNPFPFHNSTFAPPIEDAKPKTRMYHYNKTKYAIDNWYNIINIRDWVDEDEVLSLLDKATHIKDAPVLHRYNPKSKEHLIDEWYDIKNMLSNWFVEIRDWGELYLIND